MWKMFDRKIVLIALVLGTIAAIFACAGCAGTKEAGENSNAILQADGEIPLIPREVFFGNPDRAAVRLSPDGNWISYLAESEGVLNVWVGPVSDPSAAKPVTSDKKRGIRTYFWSKTGSRILYIQDIGGDENWRVYSVDPTTREVLDLTPLEGVKARINAVSHKHPDEMIIGLNDRDPQFHDLYRVNIKTGDRELLLENKDFAGFILDDDYVVRFANRITPDGGSEFLIPDQEGGWESYMLISMADMMTTGLAGFDKSGKNVYLYDSRNRNTAALYSLDLETNEKTLIAEDDRADISGALVHPTEYTIQAAAFNYDRKRWKILDLTIKKDLDYLRSVSRGDVEVISRTLDDRYWIVAYILDDGPVAYYFYDRPATTASYLFTNRKELEKMPLAKMHPEIITTRDKLTLVNYLSLPADADPDGDGRPDGPLPLVLDVHGGPWSRVTWGYNSWHQWFTNRGYAVLSVNFRGSTGFGKSFLNAGNMEWGRKMHDDLIDSVRWAIGQGIADPEKIAIVGGSYGGYATLAGLVFTPDVFACGVDIVGPSNLITLIESVPPYWKPIISVFTTRVGDPATEEGKKLLTERSPLTYADRIVKPLLIGQGANDPRVKQAESDQIVNAMKEKNIPVTYILYPDEGHGFHRPANRLSFYAAMDVFLSGCLGGRSEPIGDDLAGSSMQAPEGAALIPGLSEALGDLKAEEEEYME